MWLTTHISLRLKTVTNTQTLDKLSKYFGISVETIEFSERINCAILNPYKWMTFDRIRNVTYQYSHFWLAWGTI